MADEKPTSAPKAPRKTAAKKSDVSRQRAVVIAATESVRDAGRVRAVIDAIVPDVDGGRFAAKGIAGQSIQIDAHCFVDGHDQLRVMLEWGAVDGSMQDVAMTAQGNDVYTAAFIPLVPGRYRYGVSAWVDHLESWRHELKRREDESDIRVALLVGAELIEAATARAQGDDAMALVEWAAELRAIAADMDADKVAMKALALNVARAELVARHPDKRFATSVTRELVVDRKLAQFGAWYEMFPRSASAVPGQHGTFRDVEARLPYIADMGFDVLYLPPIHPIGRINRKGKNNALTAEPDDTGSPWAIGAKEGGHKAILPALGTFDEFRSLAASARAFGLEIALDIAFQCAPDHPYVEQHPKWFRHRPDGSVQYAENPPKKYQDIYPFDFESEDWQTLWNELKSIFDFWIVQGVRVFRVDNPHTKSFAFWEWVIGEVKREHPDAMFLSEAFTRPKVMHRLAKLGFTQSYTYFTWRNTKYELTEYFNELAHGPGRHYFRPNVWPNTPDILHETLQSGLRSVFMARLVLAATLAASYGIYGPAFELMEHEPREPGSEEYRDSEKYQLRHWDIARGDSLAPLIARVNQIRRDNPALQSNAGLRFCRIDNDALIAYMKFDDANENAILTIVNLDPHHAQSGWVEVDTDALDIGEDQPYQAHDLLSDQHFLWRGRWNYVLLDPERPAHVLSLRHHVRRESDFDYFE